MDKFNSDYEEYLEKKWNRCCEKQLYNLVSMLWYIYRD